MMCHVCRRPYEAPGHVEIMPCCKRKFRICARCVVLIPDRCRGMPAEAYADQYVRVHQLVCKENQ